MKIILHGVTYEVTEKAKGIFLTAVYKGGPVGGTFFRDANGLYGWHSESWQWFSTAEDAATAAQALARSAYLKLKAQTDAFEAAELESGL